jgi:hypothetical protein
MSRILDPFRFVLITVDGWMNQRQLQAIEYLKEENRVLHEQLGDRRLRLTDDQRRRLAVKAKELGEEASPRSGNDCHPGDAARLAPETDRAEVRREWQAEAGAATQS